MSDISFSDYLGGIPYGAAVRVTQMQGHLFEVQYLENLNKFCPIMKLSKDEYVPLVGEDKGEVKQFNHIDNRSQSFSSLKQTFKNLRYLINNNFCGAENELFCTLTYSDNMTDNKQLYVDFDRFMKRFRRKYKDVDYLSVIEPQGRGAWHVHLLLRFNGIGKAYIPNTELRQLWKQGFVNVRRLDNVDNIGAYLTAYLADYAITDGEVADGAVIEQACRSCIGIKDVEVEENGKIVKKKVLKGGRLYLYPPGINLYRHSKGIKKPVRIDTYYDDTLKKGILKSAQPQYTKGIELKKYSSDVGSDEHFNTIVFESYNLKRNSSSSHQK